MKILNQALNKAIQIDQHEKQMKEKELPVKWKNSDINTC